jgi:EAL domain-containing protein (putative c-di-GMP-specific phosphodiesterase class I)
MYDAQTQQMVGIETLIRSSNDVLSQHGAHVFISVAETTGLIKRIDRWVIEQAIRDYASLTQDHEFDGILSINISGIELLDEHFPHYIHSLIREHHLSAERIELEVTETALVPDNPMVIKVIDQLNQFGFQLSLDDFGTGYTSFNQLILYPAKSLKIDRSFVMGMFSEDDSYGKMVATILNLAKIYQLRVIAEGVETQAQLDYLREIGCDWIQGYLLSKPMSLNDLTQHITDSKKIG